MASVDVVVPCYNYARFLDRCVGSVLGQAGVDVRVLIIDDCSTDDSAERGAALAARDARVTFSRHLKNKGHIATYNEGLLDWAAADYSLLLSADDLLTPGALGRAAAIMDRHPDVGLTYGPAIIIGDEEAPPPAADPPLDYRVIEGMAFVERSFAIGNPVPTPSAVVRTAAQKKLGGYLASLPHTGDMEMWLRFAADGDVGIMKAPQAFYRQHATSMSVNYYARTLGDRREKVAAFKRIHDQWQSRHPELPALFDKASRTLAAETLWIASDAFNRGDTATADTCIAAAQEMCPGEYASRRWWKLRLKRGIGATLWRGWRPLVTRRRAAHADPGTESPQHAAATPAPPRREPMQIGWLPDMTSHEQIFRADQNV